MFKKSERGYILIGALILITLGALLSASMIDMTVTGTRTRGIAKTQAQYQYECEETLNKVVAWFQANSKNIVSAFKGAAFNSNFTLGSPADGANEGEHFQVPSMVKMKDTNNSVMLSSNDFFGTPAFPATQNIDTGAAFDAVSAFRSADLGSANARAILMWARHTDGNYEPVFRVDAVTGNNPDRGAHMFTFVYTQLVVTTGAAAPGIGFYTEDGDLVTQTGNNQCFSYKWTHDGTSWSKGAPRSNCIVASKKNIILRSKINGDALSTTTDGVQLNGPNGEVSGTVCGAPSCHNHSLSPFPDWSTTCNGHSRGNLAVSTDTNLGSGPLLDDQCWEKVTIDSGKTLTLSDKVNPYRFKEIEFKNQSNARLAFPDMGPNEKVTMFLDNWNGGKVNGNQLFNQNNSPGNLLINITGSSSFHLNGTADMNARFVAPLADIFMNGNFIFHGSVECSEFEASGNARFNYDENINAAAVPAISDLKITLKKAGQRYR